MTHRLGVLSLELHFPAAHSLKEKRSILKSLLAKIRATFNVSVAEVGHQEVWQRTRLVVAVVSGNGVEVQKTFAAITGFVEGALHEGIILEATEEIF
ncbi:MAG: hypothetical protein DDT34_00324 [Firmicutes bacterium]|nr:hypothetical protein [Bacillota bacterium]MBT9152894.1 hypothetical protein [Bacillota bacterium]MBT9157062.1 hypothetical protein [Bacillota bacterium]